MKSIALGALPRRNDTLRGDNDSRLELNSNFSKPRGNATGDTFQNRLGSGSNWLGSAPERWAPEGWLAEGSGLVAPLDCNSSQPRETPAAGEELAASAAGIRSKPTAADRKRNPTSFLGRGRRLIPVQPCASTWTGSAAFSPCRCRASVRVCASS